MKLSLNKRGKLIVIQSKGRQQRPHKKLTAHERYVIRAKEYGVDYILSEGEYNATVRINREKGRKVNYEVVARWQQQGEHTDAQIRAMLHAAQLNDPTLSRRQFIEQEGWKNIESQASAMYVQLKTLYPNLSTTEIGQIIGQQIYGSP